jgi:CubicO group peptidase (beta-lactamase class C family)
MTNRTRYPTALGYAIGYALAVAWLLGSAEAHAQTAAERIVRVEQGLLPRAVRAGERGKLASIPERMAYHGIPGMSMAVIENGMIVWAKAFGVREAGGNAPVTTETLFQGASLSKPVSALGTLMLAEQERLDLDGDVRQWMRSWKPDEGITLRQLLSHTSGLSVSGFAGYAPGVPLPTVTQILSGQPPANNDPVRATIPPGTQVRYSGGGYVVVQQLVMDVTRLPFGEYMRRAVLAPLGMTASSFDQPLSTDRARVAAAGHRRNGSRLDGGWMVHPELAAAGLWTTPTDLARLIIALQDALSGRRTPVVGTEIARQMLTARADNAGLGVFLAGPNGPSRRFMHSGRNAGFDALLVAYKNGRQGAVVMINRNNNEGFINEVLESVAREYEWPDYVSDSAQLEYAAVASSVQAPYAGVYEAEGRPSLSVVFEDDKLFARSGDDVWLRMYPVSDTEFVSIDKTTRWTFVRSAGGAMNEMIVRSGETELHRRRRGGDKRDTTPGGEINGAAVPTRSTGRTRAS